MSHLFYVFIGMLLIKTITCELLHAADGNFSAAGPFKPFSSTCSKDKLQEIPIIDQQALKVVFDNPGIETKYALNHWTLEKDIPYKTFSNGISIWCFPTPRANLVVYVLSFGSLQEGDLIYYIFDRDVTFYQLGGTNQNFKKSFADAFILAKLGELDPSLNTKITYNVSLYIDRKPPAYTGASTICFYINDQDIQILNHYFYEPIGNDDANADQNTWDSSRLPIDALNKLNLFNQLIARNPKLHIAPYGHGSPGATTYTTSQHESAEKRELRDIPPRLIKLLSPQNKKLLQSIDVELRTCNGGSCLVNAHNQGAMLESLLRAFDKEFPRLEVLCGVAATAKIVNGNIFDLTTLTCVNDIFSFKEKPVQDVIGSNVKIKKEGDIFQYSACNLKGKDPKFATDPLLLSMVNLRANFLVALAKPFKEGLRSLKTTREDIIQAMGRNEIEDDFIFRMIAQIINLEVYLSRYLSGLITPEVMENIIRDLKNDVFISPPSSPEETLLEWQKV